MSEVFITHTPNLSRPKYEDFDKQRRSELLQIDDQIIELTEQLERNQMQSPETTQQLNYHVKKAIIDIQEARNSFFRAISRVESMQETLVSKEISIESISDSQIKKKFSPKDFDAWGTRNAKVN